MPVARAANVPGKQGGIECAPVEGSHAVGCCHQGCGFPQPSVNLISGQVPWIMRSIRCVGSPIPLICKHFAVMSCFSVLCSTAQYSPALPGKPKILFSDKQLCVLLVQPCVPDAVAIPARDRCSVRLPALHTRLSLCCKDYRTSKCACFLSFKGSFTRGMRAGFDFDARDQPM